MVPQFDQKFIEDFLSVHFLILKDLLNSISFPESVNKYSTKIDEINYLDIATKNNFILLDNDKKLIAAYPVSPTPTIFEVLIENIGSGFAMCAIDALGIAYTFQEKTKIISVTKDDKKSVIIEIDPKNDKIESNHDFYISYRDPDLVKNIAMDQCPVINFYSVKESIKGPNMIVFEFNEALAQAKSIFSIDAFKNNLITGFKAIEKGQL